MWTVLSHPEQLPAARANRAALDLVIEETLRWEPASPAFGLTPTAPLAPMGTSFENRPRCG